MKCYLFYSGKTNNELVDMLNTETKLPSNYIFVIQNILYNKKKHKKKHILQHDNYSNKYHSDDIYLNNIKLCNLTLSKDYHCKKCNKIIDFSFDTYCPECGIYDPFYYQEDIKNAKMHRIFSKLAWIFTTIWVVFILGLVFNINDNKNGISPIVGIILVGSAFLSVMFHSFVKTINNSSGLKMYSLVPKEILGKYLREPIETEKKQQENPKINYWICQHCGEINEEDFIVCSFCQKEHDALSDGDNDPL